MKVISNLGQKDKYLELNDQQLKKLKLLTLTDLASENNVTNMTPIYFRIKIKFSFYISYFSSRFYHINRSLKKYRYKISESSRTWSLKPCIRYCLLNSIYFENSFIYIMIICLKLLQELISAKIDQKNNLVHIENFYSRDIRQEDLSDIIDSLKSWYNFAF